MLSTRMLALSLLLGCSVGGVDKPELPETDYVLASFAMPTGSVADRSPSERALLLAQPLELLHLLCAQRAADRCQLVEVVLSSLAKVADALRRRDAPDAGRGSLSRLPRSATGALHVDTICDGWVGGPADPAHGKFEFDVGFSGRGLDSIGSGDFTNCQLLLAEHKLSANGKLLYTFQPAPYVPFNQLRSHALTLAFDGTMSLPDELRELAVQVALRNEGPAISFSLPDIGSFIASFVGDDIEVQARDQRLRCRTEEMVCDVLSQP